MAHIEGDNGPGKLVQALQSPTAVVSYRAVVGVAVTIILALVAYEGRTIQDGQGRLEQMMGDVRVSVAQNTGRIDNQNERIGRVELSVQSLAEKNGMLDHRVTVVETRQGIK